MHPALNNSLILSKVFDHLEEDEKALKAVIQVNKKWFDRGTSVLWRCAPMERLARIPDDRRQIYASHMTSLDFWSMQSPHYHSMFKHFRFARVTRLCVSDRYAPKDDPLFARQYFGPSLETFIHSGDNLDPFLLEFLHAACKNLKRFVAYSMGPGITAEFFQQFLQSFPSIERLVLLDDSSDVITDELLLHLADRDNLKSLNLRRAIDGLAIDDISMGVLTPFRALQDLVISIPSSAVPILVDMIKDTITSLSLEVEDGPAGVLEHVSRLSQLRDFNISSIALSGARLSFDEIVLLRHLVKLEHLSIMAPVNLPPLIVDDISDHDLGLLLMHLPRLKTLIFRAECCLSEGALHCISKYCPELRYLNLLQPFHLAGLDLDTRPHPMFPNLTEFVFGGILDSCWERRLQWVGHMEAFGLARLIRHHFPKMVRLHGDDYYTERVRVAWKALAVLGDAEWEESD